MGLPNRVAADEIKALSIKRPDPHYQFPHGKDVDNRDWYTNCGGGPSCMPASRGENWIPTRCIFRDGAETCAGCARR